VGRGPALTLAYLSIGRHIHTERWLTWFARRGHQVHLLTVQPGPMPGVTVHDITTRFGPKPLRYAVSLLKVKRLLARIAPDLLHTHFLTGYGYWGHFSGRRPHVLTVWGDDVYVTPHETPLKKHLARRALAGADWVTGDSEDIVRACVELGAPPDRSEVVQWGVDFARFHGEVSGDAVRRELGIPPGAPVVLSTRSFTQPYYNIDVIVDTAPRVREKHPGVHYVIAGNEGDDRAFRTRAESVGLTDRVHWVGRIPHPRLPEYLAASTVFLTVPSVDATAVSLLEAMACRCAIVATDLPSAAEWVIPETTGLTVRPRDGGGLVAAVLRYLEDPELRDRVGAGAERVVRAKADHEVNMARVEAIYRDLVEGRVPVLPAAVAAGAPGR
jgi:glycosyltransferase involved in cell wall biosynthesis